MANELANLFNEVLIVPVNKKITDNLENLYDEVVGHDDFDYEACIRSFVLGEDCGTEIIVQELYEDKYGERVILPSVCYRLYDQYVSYWYICHDDEIDDDSRLAASLTLRNLLTLHGGRYDQMISYMYVDEIYNYYKQYIKKASLPLKDIKPLTILGQKTFTQEQKDDINLFLKTKALAVKAAKYDFLMQNRSMAKESYESPYVKAYVVAYVIANTENWEYVVTEPVQIIEEILGDYKHDRMLITIRQDFKNVEGYVKEEPNKTSSVILGYLYDESNHDKLSRLKFTPLSFAQHLFFELLSESC